MIERTDILLVEDNQNEAELTFHALKKIKLLLKMVHLDNGEEALDYIFATGKYEGRNIMDFPRVILLDLNMPKVNGIEVLRRIKGDERTRIIPVVILTTSSEQRDVMTCYDLGANSYIIKPVEYDNFVKSLTGIGMYWLFNNHLPV